MTLPSDVIKIKCMICKKEIDIPQHFMTAKQAYEYALHHDLFEHSHFEVEFRKC